MGEVKTVTISGFRGINTPPLKLDFQKNGKIQSMMIYGRNGSGKSSIVDSWEWIHFGKVKHLAREGAGERAFPHKEAKGSQTWMEIEFSNTDIGKIRVEFDTSRVTIPKTEGNLSKLKEIVSFPCHLRYCDLNEFAYETKAKKYEILSYQIGFGNALEIQDQLQKCTNKLKDKLSKLESESSRYKKEYSKISGDEIGNVVEFILIVNEIFERHEIIFTAKDIQEARIGLNELKKLVENDEKSKELSFWEDIERLFDRLHNFEDTRLKLTVFHKDLKQFNKNENEISKIILLDLYKYGIEALESLDLSDKCPLCDQLYEGKLVEHIRSQQTHLNELRVRRETLEESRKKILSSIERIIKLTEDTISELDKKEPKIIVIQFKEMLEDSKPLLVECKDMLEKHIEKIESDFDFTGFINAKEFDFFLSSEPEIKKLILLKVEELKKDDSRKILVDDFQKTTNLIEAFDNFTKSNQRITRFLEIERVFEKIKSDYIEETKNDILSAFNEISSDVTTYFNIIERESDTLQNPKIKLDPEKNKAVELEITFGGEEISPSFKYLSESQLNSIGLSIFLASVKHFNPKFKFLILDDIINSFDGYKRPRVIDLLLEHFSDYQILLLTHDSVWADQLQKKFPQWIRNHFVGWDYTIGPIIRSGKNCYEQIDELLLNDNPSEAGRAFGVYLEGILQELCEKLGAEVKYNCRNAFTLSELFQSFETRMKKQLKGNNSVVKSIQGLKGDIGFRNFCAHWKETEVPYTSEEIKDIIQKWKDIENEISCRKCNKFVNYEKNGTYEHISCPCRCLNLKQEKYYSN
jgi:hypothetical protein